MVNSSYLSNRKQYSRPQGMLFANSPGYIEDNQLVPQGTEFNDFIVLSDDNRKAINISTERIENRVRTINGRMRSYHVADKIKIDVSWDMLPSRSSASPIVFTDNGLLEFQSLESLDNLPKWPFSAQDIYTTDQGAGGVDILDWYDNNQGSFWVYLAYDNYKNFETDQRDRLSEYSQVVEVFFSDFQYSVEKRGSNNHDFWNISLSLEEV